MRSNYRLTIHVENAEQTRMETGKVLQLPKNKTVKETKTKTFTTLSFYCSSKRDCMAKLKSLQSEYTIAKGKDYKKKDKFEKELYNISFIN